MRRSGQRTAWIRARAANALRRSLTIALVGGFTALGVISALLLVPRRATREATAVTAQIPERPDTVSAARARDGALLQVRASDSILAGVRAALAAVPPTPPDTLPVHLRPRREELRAAVATLNRLIARAVNSPLAESYRALASHPLMAGAPEAPSLLESLAALERERESFGNVSSVDPAYIALTGRVSAVGRAIISAAELRRSQFRTELVPLLPPRPPPHPQIDVDTLRVAAERAEAERIAVTAGQELASMRERSREVDELERRASQLRNVGAPLNAMLAAALAIGIALGFAVALVAEVRNPRVADVREAEQTAGARVLAVVSRSDVPFERDRRDADLTVPPVIEPFAEHYRQLYLHLMGLSEPLASVIFTGAEREIAAAVAINVAAFDVHEARAALVVDTDPIDSMVARTLRLRSEPGLTGVVAGAATWAEALRYVTIGRDQTLHVMPSGRRLGRPSAENARRVRSDLTRIASRYDMVMFVAAPGDVREDPSSVLTVREVVLCAQLGKTTVRTLRRLATALRGAGMTVHGLVLWNTDLPPISSRASVAGGAEPEQAELTAGRA